MAIIVLLLVVVVFLSVYIFVLRMRANWSGNILENSAKGYERSEICDTYSRFTIDEDYVDNVNV